MQAEQISVNEAVAGSPAHVDTLLAMAAHHRLQHRAADQCETLRSWQPDAGTWCYATHIAVSGQAAGRLAWLADVFYHAAALPQHPWYPEFLGGCAEALSQSPPAGIARHQLCWGRFDLGLPAPRYYRQLVSLATPEAHTAVIAARSVDQGPALPDGARLAYTLPPNGEVLHFDAGLLHWHHICCTTGAAVLPGAADRWLINLMRRLGLDGAERDTYRREAEALRDWLQRPDTVPGNDVKSVEP
ncbi:hypothetical protein [Pseudohalioglobus sediminis]|nr:hypothetical protein [Pseudohalioglobus sediminis]